MRCFNRLWVAGELSLALALSACGGGGGSTPPPTPAPNPLFVATNGSDTNLGDAAHPLSSITRAAAAAANGYTIVVAPGTYRQTVTTERHGTLEPKGLTFIADVTGDRTGRGAGPVIIDASSLGGAIVFKLANTPMTAMDGFTIIGGPGKKGIVVSSDSTDAQVRNCIVHDNGDDGIAVQDSSSVLIFNNLVYNNTGAGVSIGGKSIGSAQAHIINNTIFGNRFRGIDVGTTTKASPNAFIRNNIVQNNGHDFNIKVFTLPNPDSLATYDADFNLVFPATYSEHQAAGIHDIGLDAKFVDVNVADFHLRGSSPAINAGDSLNGLQALANALRNLTTTGGTNCDKSAIDIGYHYPPSGRCTAVSSSAGQ